MRSYPAVSLRPAMSHSNHSASKPDPMSKPARTLTFKCKKCTKPVTLFLQKVSACSHITPYQGFCKCGEMVRHATGDKDAVESFVSSVDGSWAHHHHHHH